MRFYPILLCTILSLSASAFGETFGETFGEPEFLPVDEAFQLTVIEEKDKVALLWRVEPGYYLYKHRIQVTGSERIGALSLPVGVPKFDEYFGDVEIYDQNLEAAVEMFPGTEAQITISYQGCADQGICYPPRKVDYIVKMVANSH